MKRPDEEWIDLADKDNSGTVLWLVAGLLSFLIVVGLLFASYVYAYSGRTGPQVIIGIEFPTKKADRIIPWNGLMAQTTKLEI